MTRRIKPLAIDGRVIHQIGLPFHWGFAGKTVGGNANDLTSLVADPNVSMHEGKAFACQIHPGRHNGHMLKPTVTAAPWPTREPVPNTPSRRSARGTFAMNSVRH